MQHPHCWMCETPALFRPVQQWIFALDNNQLRERLTSSDEHLTHYSPKDRDWIQQTIQDLPPPSVSCYRGWGTPIPIFQCQKCGGELSDARIVKAIRTLVSRRGADSWFKLAAEDLLPPNTLCLNCDAKEFRKEFTTLDGRFAVILNAINNLAVKGNNIEPIKVYFFYSDQFHKWFTQFILTSIAISGSAPSNVELTGDVSNVQSVDVSQSWMDKYPKDVLRLLCLQPDLDPSLIGVHLQQCQDEYNTIQKLFTMILSYLEDFSLDLHDSSLQPLLTPDKQVLATTAKAIPFVDFAYQRRDFYRAWCLLRDFCQSDLQQFCDHRFNASETAQEKRSCQTALSEILYALIQRFAPIIPFFSEQTYALIRMWEAAASAADCAQRQDESELSSIFFKNWISHVDLSNLADGGARSEQSLEEGTSRSVTGHE